MPQKMEAMPLPIMYDAPSRGEIRADMTASTEYVLMRELLENLILEIKKSATLIDTYPGTQHRIQCPLLFEQHAGLLSVSRKLTRQRFVCLCSGI
jgi:hypothetical protein